MRILAKCSPWVHRSIVERLEHMGALRAFTSLQFLPTSASSSTQAWPSQLVDSVPGQILSPGCSNKHVGRPGTQSPSSSKPKYDEELDNFTQGMLCRTLQQSLRWKGWGMALPRGRSWYPQRTVKSPQRESLGVPCQEGCPKLEFGHTHTQELVPSEQICGLRSMLRFESVSADDTESCATKCEACAPFSGQDPTQARFRTCFLSRTEKKRPELTRELPTPGRDCSTNCTYYNSSPTLSRACWTGAGCNR